MLTINVDVSGGSANGTLKISTRQCDDAQNICIHCSANQPWTELGYLHSVSQTHRAFLHLTEYNVLSTLLPCSRLSLTSTPFFSDPLLGFNLYCIFLHISLPLHCLFGFLLIHYFLNSYISICIFRSHPTRQQAFQFNLLLFTDPTFPFISVSRHAYLKYKAENLRVAYKLLSNRVLLEIKAEKGAFLMTDSRWHWFTAWQLKILLQPCRAWLALQPYHFIFTSWAFPFLEILLFM